MSYLPSHDHMLEATLAHTGLDDLKLCGQRQHTHATVAVAAPSSGSRRSPPRSQISSFPQHAIPQITRLSPSIFIHLTASARRLLLVIKNYIYWHYYHK